MPLTVTYADRPDETLTSLSRPGRVHVEYANGDTFDGDVVQANTGEYVFHGRGRYVWRRAGAAYEGDYDHGKKHGVGSYRYPTGMVYRGHWVNGHKHGAVSYTHLTLPTTSRG